MYVKILCRLEYIAYNTEVFNSLLVSDKYGTIKNVYNIFIVLDRRVKKRLLSSYPDKD